MWPFKSRKPAKTAARMRNYRVGLTERHDLLYHIDSADVVLSYHVVTHNPNFEFGVSHVHLAYIPNAVWDQLREGVREELARLLTQEQETLALAEQRLAYLRSGSSD